MSREIKNMVMSSRRIVGYEWLESSGWKHYFIDLDISRDDGSLMRTHKNSYPWFAAGCLDRYAFTGLLDKEGKELYEGHLTEHEIESGTLQGQVIFSEENSAYCLLYKIKKGVAIYDMLHLVGADSLKIIGHIAEEQK